METKTVENGKIDDILDLDAFKVHDIMFNVKDIIQCLFLCSKTMHDYFHNPNTNIFILTISTENSFIMGMPMSTNEKYIDSVIRNNENITPQSEVHKKKNTYTIKDDKIMMCCTKGFILDNFKIKDSYHDFRVSEKQTNVVLYATDIESLTVKDPDLE